MNITQCYLNFLVALKIFHFLFRTDIKWIKISLIMKYSCKIIQNNKCFYENDKIVFHYFAQVHITDYIQPLITNKLIAVVMQLPTIHKISNLSEIFWFVGIFKTI